jgi:hypothetical protein
MAVNRRRLELRRVLVAVAGAVAVMAVIAVAFGLGPAIGAARGQGASGTFTVESRICSRGCTWVGTFESKTGQVLSDAAYEGDLPPGARLGSSIPALYPGGADEVFAPHGSHMWLSDLVLIVVVGGVVAVAVWISPIPIFRNRRPQGAGDG